MALLIMALISSSELSVLLSSGSLISVSKSSLRLVADIPDESEETMREAVRRSAAVTRGCVITVSRLSMASVMSSRFSVKAGVSGTKVVVESSLLEAEEEEELMMSDKVVIELETEAGPRGVLSSRVTEARRERKPAV